MAGTNDRFELNLNNLEVNMNTGHPYFSLETEPGPETTAGSQFPEAQLRVPCGQDPDRIHLWRTLLTHPKSARVILDQWVKDLPLARQNAAASGFGQGALFYPSMEQSASELPVPFAGGSGDNKTLLVQMTETSDRVWLLINYYRLTLDFDLWVKGGADVLFDSSRLWLGLDSGHQEFHNLENVLLDHWVLQALVCENLRWTARIWTMLELAGKRELVMLRTGMTQIEIDQVQALYNRLASQLPKVIPPVFSLGPGHLQKAAPDQINGRTAGPLADTGLALQATNNWDHFQESVYLSLVGDLGGLVLEDDSLNLRPKCPADWRFYAFRMAYRGSRMLVQVDGVSCQIKLTEGAAQMITVYKDDYLLEDELSVPLDQSAVDQTQALDEEE